MLSEQIKEYNKQQNQINNQQENLQQQSNENKKPPISKGESLQIQHDKLKLQNEENSKQEETITFKHSNMNKCNLHKLEIDRLFNGAIIKVQLYINDQDQIMQSVELLEDLKDYPTNLITKNDNNCFDYTKTVIDDDGRRKYLSFKISDFPITDNYKQYKYVIENLGKINLYIIRHFEGKHNLFKSKKEKVMKKIRETKNYIDPDINYEEDNKRQFRDTTRQLILDLDKNNNNNIKYVFLSDLKRTHQSYEKIKSISENYINFPNNNNTYIIPEIHEIDYGKRGNCNEATSTILGIENHSSMETNSNEYNKDYYNLYLNEKQINKNNYKKRKNRPKSLLSLPKGPMSSNINHQVIRTLELILNQESADETIDFAFRNENNDVSVINNPVKEKQLFNNITETNILLISHNSRIRCYLKELFTMYSSINQLNTSRPEPVITKKSLNTQPRGQPIDINSDDLNNPKIIPDYITGGKKYTKNRNNKRKNKSKNKKKKYKNKRTKKKIRNRNRIKTKNKLIN